MHFALAALALALTGLFAVLRSALLHSVPSRVLEPMEDERAQRMRSLLDRAERLATSASIFEISCQIFFVVLVLAAIGDGDRGPSGLVLTLVVAVPPLVFASELMPAALRGERSDALLRLSLPSFSVLQAPFAAVIYGLEATRQATMRLFRIPERPSSARTIVEDLRNVVEEYEFEGELDEAEREMIENVIEFHDADVAQVMTPRTELKAVEVEASVDELIGTISRTGHTRIPVYEGNLDTIIGLAYAQEILQAMHENGLEGYDLRRLLRPVTFVPETKLVSELLREFRRDKQKTAVVLDEYGGTSGLVTLGDIVTEIVGEMREELGEDSPEPMRRLDNGITEVIATMRISDVNEELDLDLPEEEDYETLAGFVLARLGHFPKRGERFDESGFEYEVVEANDRRVLKVRIRPNQAQAG